MPNDITAGSRSAHFVEGYIDTLRILAQQTSSKLSDICMEKTFLGNETKLDYIGQVTINERTEMHKDVATDEEANRERRSISPRWYEHPAWFDPRQDTLTQSMEPTSEYRQIIVAAYMRFWDKLIIDAYLGSVDIDGNAVAHDAPADLGPGGSTTPGENRIDYDYSVVNDAPANGEVVKGYGLSADKIIGAVRRLKASDVGLEGRKYVVCHPNQVEQVLTSTYNSGELDPRIANADYNSKMALEVGDPTYFMGCEWRQTTQVQPVAATAFGTQPAASPGVGDLSAGRYAYVVTEDAVACFKAPAGLEVTLDRVPHKGNSYLLYHNMAMGALRIEGKRVCPIECAEGTVGA